MTPSEPERDNDESPLLAENARQSTEVWEDREAITRQYNKEVESKSSWYLFLLTLSIGGLQIVWSVEVSNGSPYLISLGMNKSLLAFVWIAGPLTGTLVQPYIGIRSDNCRVPWGKRKPFMAGGGLATILCLMALAWVREMVSGALWIFGAGPESKGVKITTIVVATLLMFCLDFAINTVQAAIRAFIVDNAPAHQQESANAWASRQTGVGNILGYISGYLDLPKILPFFGNTQFKVLCVIASIALGSTLIMSCSYIQERDPRLEGPPRDDNPNIISFFKQVFASIKRLPPQIRKVCEVQVCAWVGWFPFLFYSTTYIGQLYVNPIFDEHPDLPENAISEIWEQATRVGTFALLIYAITSFIASMVLPLLVVPTCQSQKTQEPDSVSSPSGNYPYLRRHPSASTLSFTASVGPAIETSQEPARETGEKKSFLSKIQIPGLTLPKMWFLSHILFTLCMFSTLAISTPQAGTVVIAIVGISWALTLWAPFALISEEVAAREENQRRLKQIRRRQSATPGTSPQQSRTEPGDDAELHGVNPMESREETVDQAGVILGIHNVAISFPQIVSTLISSVIFKALQKPRGQPWDDSVGWVLRFGGCAALGAAYFTTRLGKGHEDTDSGNGGDAV